MTTHAEETNGPTGPGPHGITPDGAPQAGGFSGVAATPGEGAVDTTPRTLRQRLDDLCDLAFDISALGKAATLSDFDELRAEIAGIARDFAPAPSSPRAEAPEAEPALDATAGPSAADVFPDLGEALDRAADIFMSWLPNNNRATDDQDRFKARQVIFVFLDALGGYRSKPCADCAAKRYARGNDQCEWCFALLVIATLSGPAALRRAAPGAAPEHAEELFDGFAGDDVADLARLVEGDPRAVGDTLTERIIALVASLRATPAPTGERAGGEELEAIERCVRRARGIADYRLTYEAGLSDEMVRGLRDQITECDAALYALRTLRPPVAAPRGTEGRDDA